MEILIVDDELVSRKKIERLLQGLGHQVRTAVNGEEAWKIWESERIRMVVTDWVMPGMDGIELCRKIRNTPCLLYTYIIMVTARRGTRDLVEGMNAGADDFISKPFIREELSVRIRAAERVLAIESRDIVIFSMARLAESRDSETGNHLERIRYYSRALAEALGRLGLAPDEINSQFVDNIFLTSPMHDIGKIGIPDHVLLKPGRLDDREFSIMKTHSRIGFETLHDALLKYPQAKYLKMSAEIALSHHEKYDGTGYPEKRKGEEIPLPARIVALSDVYDALVSKRVYKNAFPHEIVRAMILQERGSQFDPRVTDAFLACEQTFFEIFSDFRDG